MVIGIAHLQPIVALIAGILILIMPRLLNFIVAVYLIVSVIGRPWDLDLSAKRKCGLASAALGVFLGAVSPPNISFDPWPNENPRASALKPKNRQCERLQSPSRRPSPRAGQGKWVYGFGDGRAEGKAAMRNLLGGKGAGLAEMANLGLPVPPGFTITTEVCTFYYANKQQYPKELRAQVEKALAAGRPDHRQDFRRQEQSAAGLRALRRAAPRCPA